MTREKEVERYLVKQVEKHGGKAYKWVSPGNRGVPDRIVILPGIPEPFIMFAELKTARGRLRPEQKVQRKTLTGLGCLYVFINCKDDVDLLFLELGVEPVRKSNAI